MCTQNHIAAPSDVGAVHAQEEAQALRERLGELEVDHKAAIAAHSALEEHLDSQATAREELATLRCAHAELEADHAQAIATHGALQERLFELKDLQRRHESLEARFTGSLPLPCSFAYACCLKPCMHLAAPV